MYLGATIMTLRIFVIACSVFALLQGSPALAQQYDPCPDVPAPAGSTGAPPSLETLEEEAQAGSVGSAITLGYRYAGEEDYAKAEKWFRYALYKGDGRGALGLYSLSEEGQVKLEDPEAIKKYGLNLIEQDARSGNGGSAITMAMMYLYGQGLEKDYDQAHDWLVIAEESGKPRASYELGVLYSNGLFQAVSPRKALHYFKKAAAAGIGPATRQVAIAYHTGIGTVKDLNQAIACYERSANQGEVLAMRDLGNIYRMEKPNSGLSNSWYRKAADLGDPDAQYELGGSQWLEKAMQQKHHLARIKADPSYVPPEEAEPHE